MTRLYAAPLFVYGLLAIFAPDVIARAHKIPTLATLLSFRAWVILTLAILLFLTLDGVQSKRFSTLPESLSIMIRFLFNA